MGRQCKPAEITIRPQPNKDYSYVFTQKSKQGMKGRSRPLPKADY